MQAQIGEQLATKNDLQKMETKLVKYSNTTFVTLEGNKNENKAVLKAVERIDNQTRSIQSEIDCLNLLTKNQGAELKQKVH